MVAVLAAQAVIIVASGVLSSTPVLSTIIAGVFLVLNSVATLLIGAYLADRRKPPKRKRKPKRRGS